MSRERLVAVVGSDEVRSETIVRAFAAAGFETFTAPSIAELAVSENAESVELILDGPEADYSEEVLEDLKRRWPDAHVWGVWETARFLAGWGDKTTDATPSAEVVSCEGILTRALRRLQPTGEGCIPLHQRVMHAKRELENIIDGSPDTIFVCSLDNRVVRGNRRFFSKLGKPPAEVLGRPCHELLHGCPDDWADCVQSHALESDEPVMAGLDDLTFPGTYECTAFEVTLSGSTKGIAHHLREVGQAQAI